MKHTNIGACEKIILCIQESRIYNTVNNYIEFKLQITQSHECEWNGFHTRTGNCVRCAPHQSPLYMYPPFFNPWIRPCGGMPPMKIFDFRPSDILSGAVLGWNSKSWTTLPTSTLVNSYLANSHLFNTYWQCGIWQSGNWQVKLNKSELVKWRYKWELSK